MRLGRLVPKRSDTHRCRVGCCLVKVRSACVTTHALTISIQKLKWRRDAARRGLKQLGRNCASRHSRGGCAARTRVESGKSLLRFLGHGRHPNSLPIPRFSTSLSSSNDRAVLLLAKDMQLRMRNANPQVSAPLRD